MCMIHNSVPEEELNNFLRKEVLSKYTFLFRQEIENASPQSGIELQNFMQTALSEMQSVIEGHIHTAMGSNSA